MADSIACTVFMFKQGDNLQQILDDFQLTSDNMEESHKKLVIMLIDGAFRLEIDPIRVSDEFNKRGITLAVVAVATPDFEIWDFYSELTRNTGGEYMLLADAPRVLSRVISSVITGEYTLRQAFRHIHMEHLPVPVNDTDDVEEGNETIDGVGDMDFDCGLTH